MVTVQFMVCMDWKLTLWKCQTSGDVCRTFPKIESALTHPCKLMFISLHFFLNEYTSQHPINQWTETFFFFCNPLHTDLCNNAEENNTCRYFSFITILMIVLLSVRRGEQQQQHWGVDEPWAEHADARHDAVTPPHLHRHERTQTPASWGQLHGGVHHDPWSAAAAHTPSDPSATAPPNTHGLQVRALILKHQECGCHDTLITAHFSHETFMHVCCLAS